MKVAMIFILGLILSLSVMVNIIFVANSWSATTQNLLSNDFSDTSKWSGNNQSIRHGNNIIAFIDGGSVSSTVTLGDHLLQSEINNGFTASLDAEVWFWSNVQNQTTSSTMTITGADGTTYEQTIVAEGICHTWNGCGYEDLGTNSISVGSNTQTDFDITSTFSATAPGTRGHWASDLRLPSLTVEYNEFVLDLNLDLDIVEDIDLDINFDTFEIDDFTFSYDEPFAFEEIEFDVPIETYEFELFAYDDGLVEIDTEFEEVEIPLETYEDELPGTSFYDDVSFYDEPTEDEFEEPELDEDEIYYVEETQEVREPIIEEEVEEVEVEVAADMDAPITEDVEVVEVEHKSIDIKIKGNFDDIIRAEVQKVESIINTQPLLVDNQEFYSSGTIYNDQFVYVDTRLIYDTVYKVEDPVIQHEIKMQSNKQKQQQILSELKLLKWKN